MGILEGKKALILGVANNQSIAYGIAKVFHREGAKLAFGVAQDFLVDLVKVLVKDLDSDLVFKCDLTKDEDILNLKEKIKENFGDLDILVHSVAFAPKETFSQPVSKIQRESFKIALDVSVYSLLALVREFLSLMEKKQGAILTLSYYGSEKVIPNYNLMGLAKASLEAAVKYLAFEIGKEGLRINCISPGPVKTLAASAIPGFDVLYKKCQEISPLRKNVSLEDIGNLAAFLCSDLAKSITGEIIYIDAGYHILGFFE